MTLLEKLRTARIEFQNSNIKKTGYNPFSKFDYYELGDILPLINVLSDKYGFICTVSFTPEIASMQVIDTQDPKQAILFTSPMSTAKLTAAHDIQNLGAVQTYLRRYLYLCAFEIVEHDPVDGSSGPEQKKPESKPAPKLEEPKQTNQPAMDERKALINKIATIMETKESNQFIFSEEEKEDARCVIKQAPRSPEGIKQLKDFIEYIEHKRAEKDIPF